MVAGKHETKLFWERFYRSPLTKATAIVLIVAMTWVFVGRDFLLGHALSELNYDSSPSKARKPTKPAEKLHAAVIELQGLLAVQNKQDLSPKQASKANSARAQIAAELQALDRQFATDRVKLFKLGADDALKRLAQIENKTATLIRSLTAALAKVPTDGGVAGKSAIQASKVLTALSPEKPQQPLSSDLSFGIKNAKPRSVSLSAGITPAYSSPTSNEEPSPLPREPQPEDLQETPETRLTPAIEELASTLGHDPVKLYEYVKNNIRYEPYYGIRKGADQTLAEKAGSDADQAALLVALMRESGIHARFVQGVAELPAQKAANWLGVDVANGERMDAVPEILWSGGIPANTTRVSGQLTKVRFNHIWAEGYVAQEAYRGVDEGIGGKAWTALDASIKETEFKRPVADFKELLEPAINGWAQSFVDGSQAVGEDGIIAPPPAQTQQDTQQLLDQAQDVLGDNGIDDDSTLSDVIGSREIKQAKLSYLPASTQFRTSSVSGELRTLPDSLNASVSLAVAGSDPLAMPSADPEQTDDSGFSFTAKTLDLANKRITVSYVPATDQDEEIVDAYHGLLNAPSYAAALIPVLRVDGKVVARGHQAVSTGYTQNFRIVYRMPGFAADAVENPVYVGSLSAVALDLGNVTINAIREHGEALRPLVTGTTADNILTDKRAGTVFSGIAQFYFARNDSYRGLGAQVIGMEAQRQLSGGLVATDIHVAEVAGFPVGIRLAGLIMDVDEDQQSVVALTTASNVPTAYMRSYGTVASSSEAMSFSFVFGGSAVSTTVVMHEAVRQQIPIFEVTSENIAVVRPQLSHTTETIADVAQAVGSGATVTIPGRQTTIDGWLGTGYVVERSGALDFRIVGGESGAWKKVVDFLLDPQGFIQQAVLSLIVGDRAAACVGMVTDAITLGGMGYATPALLAGAGFFNPGVAITMMTVATIQAVVLAYFIQSMVTLLISTEECLAPEDND